MLQVPLLHLHAASTAPVSLALSRLLPPAAPSQRPADTARAAEAQQREYLAEAAETLPEDLRHLGVAAAAWSAQMDAHFQPQQCGAASNCLPKYAIALRLKLAL